MSTVVLDHKASGADAVPASGAIAAAALAGALSSAAFVASFVFFPSQTLREGMLTPYSIVNNVVTTLAFASLATAVPTLRRVLDVPRWALYLSSAAFAAVAAMSWSLATLAPDMAKFVTNIEFDQFTAYLILFPLPTTILGLVGFTALGVAGWRRRAIPRGAAALLILAGIASLWRAYLPGPLFGALAFAWIVMTLEAGPTGAGNPAPARPYWPRDARGSGRKGRRVGSGLMLLRITTLVAATGKRLRTRRGMMLALAFVVLTAGCGSRDDEPRVAGEQTLSASTTSPRQQPIADPPADVSPLRQSPAPIHGRLFFTRTTGADVQTVFVASGGHERQLTQPGEVCCILRVAPRRGRILVMPGGEIEPPITGGTVNMSGADFSRLALTDPTLNLVPQAWSPDGSRIAFEGWDDADPDQTGIYTAHASDGSDLTRVTTRPGNVHDVPLDFSPDGKRLVFYRSVHADPDPHTGGSLWVVNADGSGAHQITTEASKPADWARWSPEGTRILFGSERLSASGPLWTVSPSGSNLAKLFEDPNGGFALAPDWSPDGSQVAFALGHSHDEFEHQPNAIYTIARDGSGLQLVNGSDDFKRQLEWVR